jgi:hypothetical protein
MIGGDRIMSSDSARSSSPLGFCAHVYTSACMTSSSSPSLVIVTAVARSRGAMKMRTGVTENSPASAGEANVETTISAQARFKRAFAIGTSAVAARCNLSPPYHYLDVITIENAHHAP